MLPFLWTGRSCNSFHYYGIRVRLNVLKTIVRACTKVSLSHTRTSSEVSQLPPADFPNLSEVTAAHTSASEMTSGGCSDTGRGCYQPVPSSPDVRWKMVA